MATRLSGDPRAKQTRPGGDLGDLTAFSGNGTPAQRCRYPSLDVKSSQTDDTDILNDSNQIRIELY